MEQQWGLPWWLSDTESACSAGVVEDSGFTPGSERFPGGGHGNPFQYSCLENPHGLRSLAGYSPCGHKELDMAERLHNNHAIITPNKYKKALSINQSPVIDFESH